MTKQFESGVYYFGGKRKSHRCKARCCYYVFPSESQAVGRDALSVRVGGRQRRTLTDVVTMCGPTGPVAFVRPNTLINSRERRL